MAGAHRESDTRLCGATNIVEGQSTVYVNGQLWAVENDQDTHLEGRLISTIGSTVFIEGKKVIVLGDTATTDLAGHTPPLTDPATASGDVEAY